MFVCDADGLLGRQQFANAMPAVVGDRQYIVLVVASNEAPVHCLADPRARDVVCRWTRPGGVADASDILDELVELDASAFLLAGPGGRRRSGRWNP
jgi:hypothetical protein